MVGFGSGKRRYNFGVSPIILAIYPSESPIDLLLGPPHEPRPVLFDHLQRQREPLARGHLPILVELFLAEHALEFTGMDSCY